MSFLFAELISEPGKFTISDYYKPTASRSITHIYSFYHLLLKLT